MELKLLAKEFIFDCEARNLSQGTIKGYEKQLSYFLCFLSEHLGVHRLDELTAAHIKQYVVACQRKGLKPSYVNDLLKPVKRLCTYAFEEGYTEEVITKRVKNVKEPKVLIHTFSSREIQAMIQYFSGSDYLSVRNRLIMMILFDTGVRISEIINLKPCQVKEGYFTIYGKGRKERVVPLNPTVSKWLIRYEAVRDRYFEYRFADEYLFLSKNGRRLTEEAVCKFMKTAAATVGVNPQVRVSPHTCRHTFAQQELKNGLDLCSLSRLLGHESVSITQRYLESMENAQVLQRAKKTSVLANL